MRSHAHRLVHRAHRSGAEPDVDVLVALHVLMSLACGEPPEVVRGLRLTDIEATAAAEHDAACESMTRAQRLTYLATHDLVESYALTYTKNRAHETYQEIYTRRHHSAHRTLTRALTLTGRLRRDCTLNHLWIHRRAGGEVVEAGWRSKAFALKDWLHRGGIEAEGAPYFIRFRKAVTAAEALANPARYLRDTRRHGAETFFGHYASSPVLRAEAGRLLITTIDDYFDAAVHGPTVITAEAETLLAEQQHTELLDDRTARALLDGDLDGPHTACRDPRNSPYTPTGQTCDRSTTGTCFGCPNALITRHHLPAALLIAELADPNRAADPAAWLEHWKPIHDCIVNVVLPAFSAADIEAARTRVDLVPLQLGTRNDMRGIDDDTG